MKTKIVDERAAIAVEVALFRSKVERAARSGDQIVLNHLEWAASLHAVLTAPARVEGIMAAIQEYASTWSLAGGRFDQGDMMEQAEKQKACIRTAVAMDECDATRYRVLRNVSDDRIGKPGVPCIAIPIGTQRGSYANGDDADGFVDAAILASRGL